jgi:hypothetical protein
LFEVVGAAGTNVLGISAVPTGLLMLLHPTQDSILGYSQSELSKLAAGGLGAC